MICLDLEGGFYLRRERRPSFGGEVVMSRGLRTCRVFDDGAGEGCVQARAG